jgi:Ca2+:H+ antiporter
MAIDKTVPEHGQADLNWSAHLLTAIRHNPILWLLIVVPVPLVAHSFYPEAHTLLFGLSIVAIIPLAALLSTATESVAARLGDAKGGLLNATLGNLTELVITLAALRAGEYTLVKASLAGAIVTNTLFMMGGAFLIGGLKHHVQDYNRANARLQIAMLFLSTFALMAPSTIVQSAPASSVQTLSLILALVLIVTYCLGLIFTLFTHRELFNSASEDGSNEAQWPIPLSVLTLACATILVALISEIFVGSVEGAAATLGLSDAFVGFIVVALVGGAAEMAAAFSGALKNRLDLSVGIAFGSASQIALFVAPVLVLLSYLIGPAPMDLQFWPGAIAMMFVATVTTSLVSSGGRSAWFIGVLMVMVYLVFAAVLYIVPPPTA